MADQDRRYVTVERSEWDKLRADRDRLEKELAEARGLIASDKPTILNENYRMALELVKLRAVRDAAETVQHFWPRGWDMAEPMRFLAQSLAVCPAPPAAVWPAEDSIRPVDVHGDPLRDTQIFEKVRPAPAEAEGVAAPSGNRCDTCKGRGWMGYTDGYECKACSGTGKAPPAPPAPAMPARCTRFNDTTGALTWNYQSASLHPDRCKCQGNDPTPHKHYDEPPYACARCVKCEAYEPAVPEPPESPPAADAVTGGGQDWARYEAQHENELREKLRAAEAALADEKRMSDHLQEQWHASDVKLIADNARDYLKHRPEGDGRKP
jgi:hypothetical protein